MKALGVARNQFHESTAISRAVRTSTSRRGAASGPRAAFSPYWIVKAIKIYLVFYDVWSYSVGMARITVEDCLDNVSSRFELVMVAAARTRQLLKGAKPLVVSDNRDVVTALREIAAGKVRLAVPKP